jgi:hypothetical protein
VRPTAEVTGCIWLRSVRAPEGESCLGSSGALRPQRTCPHPHGYLKHIPTVRRQLRSFGHKRPNHSLDKSQDWSCYQNADRGTQLLSYCQEMSNKVQRVAGIFIAPLIMLAGLWLCLDGLEHGGLSGIFSIGPFVAVAGALWFVSDWFE